MAFTPIQAGDTGLSIREKLNSRLPMANVDVEAKAPVIDDGELVLDLGSESHTWHVVSLTESIDAGGISIVNLPDVDVIRVHLEFRRPSANAFDVPVTAFTGITGSVVFDSDWHVYTGTDTPTIAVLLSTDGGATWRVQTNAPHTILTGATSIAVADEIPDIEDQIEGVLYIALEKI